MRNSSKKYGLILGEGKKDITVLQKITPENVLDQLNFEYYEGKNKLGLFLETTLKSPGYTSGRIQRILVTRDADENWESAWQSAREAVQGVFKVKVPEPGKWQQIENGPLIAIWVAPGNNKEGMIETLYLEAAKSSDTQAFECLETYIECLKTKDSIELHEKERFDIWTIVAQGEGPAKGRKRLSFDDVIGRLSLNWNSDVFSEIKTLLIQTSDF